MGLSGLLLEPLAWLQSWLWARRLRKAELPDDDGYGKAGLLIKNSAHSARVELVLRHFPRARFVMLRRDPQASIRSLVQVKQRLGSLVGLQPCPMPSPRWRKRWKPIASCLGPLRHLGIGFLRGSWLNCPMRH